MRWNTVCFRHAEIVDLARLNLVVASAFAQWPLPERVRRLALPSYLYRVDDFEHLEIDLAELEETGDLVAVSALEPLAIRPTPDTGKGIWLPAVGGRNKKTGQ